jgi:outer membrane protein OmpA-like peptidoglycan-associated protein
MSKLPFNLKTILFLSIWSCIMGSAQGQKAGLEITRTSAVDRNSPITNIAFDGQGRKWAANGKGVFQIKTADYASPRTIAAGEKCVVAYKGGNTDFIWSDAAFKSQVKTDCKVTAAWYDEKAQILWIGTDAAGFFQFKTDPQLQLVQQYNTSNSKLKSDNITLIFQDLSNRMWIGTDKGVMYGTPGRWKSELSGFNIQRVRQFGPDIYVLNDGNLSKVKGGEKWSDVQLDIKKFEGQITDFDLDHTGKIWMVSGVLTRLDQTAGTYEVFSGPEYYTSDYGTDLMVDENDAVWVGTSDKGLYQVDKTSSMTLNAFVDQPISCNGNGKDAVLLAKVSGGDAPYTYAWTGGLKTDNPKNVGPGTYNLTVTDSKGKTRTAEVPVGDVRLRIKINQTKTVSAPGRSDGAAEVDIATNASGLVIHWDNNESRGTATQLSAGPHSVTVTDPKGCAATATITVRETIRALEVSLTSKSTIACAGDKSGNLVVKVDGGKSPYQYKWNAAGLSGDQPSNVPAGDYKVTVTDASGATKTADISIKQPEAVSAQASVTAPASTGNTDGKATVQSKGGTGAFTYQWDDGETTAAAVKLPPGKHVVTVTDANGCTATATVSISENILPLGANLVVKSGIKCAGDKTGALSVQMAGGKPPFQYSWNNPAANGDQASGLPAGEYQVVITDASGKSVTASASLKQPDPLTATASVSGPASAGNSDGQAIAIPKGGTAPYVFQWDNNETSISAAKLPPGTHQVTVTDANGCKAIAATEAITENILPFSITLKETSPIKCAGQKSALAIAVRGGKPPYFYKWNNPALTGNQPAGLDGGNYAVTVTDAKGTSMTDSIAVRSFTPLAVQLVRNIGVTNENTSDGKAVIAPTGGAGKYKVEWDTKQSGLTATKLALGNHGVTVTDANGCVQNVDFKTDKRVLPELTGTIEKGQKIRMRLLTFTSDSFNLKPEFLPMLDELYDFMMENPTVVIEIGGHTNNVPPDAFADELSTNRAKAVADYLTVKGVDPKRLIYKGYGKRLPLVANTSPEGRATNQRVEIKILKVE